MARVTGIGGVFFKCDDPEQLRSWYREHLGIESDQYGWSFPWRDHDDPDREGFTVWGPFKRETTYFDPSTNPYMVNFIVDDLDALLAQLRAAGIWVDDKIEEHDYGRFGWILDPAGTRIELWEPPKEKP
jgi:catechol 2,3-dioxygenase-like lactoylglutathione lyase family enzyme